MLPFRVWDKKKHPHILNCGFNRQNSLIFEDVFFSEFDIRCLTSRILMSKMWWKISPENFRSILHLSFLPKIHSRWTYNQNVGNFSFVPHVRAKKRFSKNFSSFLSQKWKQNICVFIFAPKMWIWSRKMNFSKIMFRSPYDPSLSM